MSQASESATTILVAMLDKMTVSPTLKDAHKDDCVKAATVVGEMYKAIYQAVEKPSSPA